MNKNAFAYVTAYLLQSAYAARGAGSNVPTDPHTKNMVLQYMPNCFLPMDLLFLQDTSLAEEEDKIPAMSRMMQDIVAILDRLHPDSYFGVAEFRDKPMEPFGWPNDVCFNLASQLTPDTDKFAEAYDNLWSGGGYDHAEDHFEAIMTAFLWNGVHWRDIGLGQGNTGARVAILLTDSLSHYAGSNDNQEYPAGMIEHDGQITQDNITVDCITKKYPQPEQLADALKTGRHQYVIMMVPDDADQHIKDFWNYTNVAILAQPEKMLQIYGSTDQDLENAVLKGLQAVTLDSCYDWYGSGMQLSETGGFRRHKRGRYNSEHKQTFANSSELLAAVPKNTDECSNPCSCECSCRVECVGAKYQCCTGDDGLVVIKRGDEVYSVSYGNGTNPYLF